MAKAIRPEIKVIAVQSAQAPAGYLSWKNRRLTDAPMETVAEGLATATGYETDSGHPLGLAGRLPPGQRRGDT